MAVILTVDDESGIREFIADTLTEAGHEVIQASNGTDALALLEDRPFDLALFDLRMPGGVSGMDLVRRARAEWPQTQVIVMTAYGTIGTAVEAVRLGAFDFLEKPVSGPEELRRLVTRALNWRGSQNWGQAPSGALAAGAATPLVATPVVRSGSGVFARLGRLSDELKRRHVYNVAATYAAVAFIVLQAAQLILPALPGLPDWAYTALVVLTIAGFPTALALGWAYDLRISKTRDRRRLQEELDR